MIISMMRQALTRLGYAVVTCASGSEALTRLRETPQDFDLAIVDYVMQDMTIEMLVQGLRLIRHDLPIVLSTGIATETISTTLQTLQCQAFLPKPYSLRELAQVIQEVIPG
jgi:two-component system cell cycle sensor histidine kinase/response regulator CckA